MPISAAFTVNGAANPAEHAVAYGATVTLALTSITGASSIQWSVVGSSHADVPTPGITPAGAPAGATATFPFMNDPGGGEGRALIIKCLVSDGSNRLRAEDEGVRWAVAYAVIGVPNGGGVVPFCVNEALYRSLTHGYVQRLNSIIASAQPPRCVLAKSANQVLTAVSGFEAITWDQEIVDRAGMHSGSSPDVTIPAGAGGPYQIKAYFSCSQAGSQRIRLNAAGSPTNLTSQGFAANVTTTLLANATLVAGDTVRLEIDIGTNGNFFGLGESSFTVERQF